MNSLGDFFLQLGDLIEENPLLHMCFAPYYYRESLITTGFCMTMGALVAFSSSLILSGRDEIVSAGLTIFLTLALNFVNFAGVQEGYTARAAYTQAVSFLRQAAISAWIGGCPVEMKAAIQARIDVAVAKMEPQFDIRTGALIRMKQYEYHGEFDRDMLEKARSNANVATAMQMLTQFDALCQTAAPRILMVPIRDMYVMLFGVLMPFSVFPLLGWWYILFSFYPTLICFGGYKAMCDANNYFADNNPEFKKTQESIMKILDDAISAKRL